MDVPNTNCEIQRKGLLTTLPETYLVKAPHPIFFACILYDSHSPSNMEPMFRDHVQPAKMNITRGKDLADTISTLEHENRHPPWDGKGMVECTRASGGLMWFNLV